MIAHSITHGIGSSRCGQRTWRKV